MPFSKSVVHPDSVRSSCGQLSYLKEGINERLKGQRRAVWLIREASGVRRGAEAKGNAADQSLVLQSCVEPREPGQRDVK